MTIKATTINKPGRIPARNSPPMDTPAMAPYTIMTMLGGMMEPMMPEVANSAAENPDLYPFLKVRM